MSKTNLIQKIFFMVIFILLSVNSVFLSADDSSDLQGEQVTYPPQEELIAHLEQRQKRAPEGVESLNLDTTYVLKTNQDTNVLSMAQEYAANSNVEYAEPNYIARIQMVLNDPYYSSKKTGGVI